MGAFESGQDAWSAGCDLDREFSVEGPSVSGIPMTNVLPNGNFESYVTREHPNTNSTTNFQLADWAQAGDITSYYSSAWNWWGEISGDGTYVMQMRSGSSLSQRVEGLKPDTVYAIAGYGRVASDYILGNEAAAGWDKDGIALGPVAPQGSIGAARTLQFEDVDFGASGADRLIVGLSGSGLGSTGEDLIIRVRLDDRVSGPVAGELLFDHWRAYGNKHEWLTVVFDEAFTGEHDVYLEFDTHLLQEEKDRGENKNPDKIGYGSLYGLFFANSEADDAVTIAARAGAGSARVAELVCKESRYTRPQRHAYVRTGADGAIDIEVAKTGAADSALLGYVDTLSLYEVLPAPEGEDPENALYFVHDGAGSVWTRGGGDPPRITFKRTSDDEQTFSRFAGVRVDGVDVPESAYDAVAGSVVVTLHADYLDGLAEGGHVLQALFDDADGGPTAAFEVRERRDAAGEPGGPAEPGGVPSASGDVPAGQPAAQPAGGAPAAGASGSPDASAQQASAARPAANATQRAPVPAAGDPLGTAVLLALAFAVAALVCIPVRRRG